MTKQLIIAACIAFATLAIKPGVAFAQTKECSGKDLLAELAASDPATHARVTSEAQATANGHGMLWKIEREGLPPSYLFGTMHLTDKRIANLSERVTTALTSASHVLLESADVSADATANALADASKAALFSNGQTLEQLLSKDEYAKVRAALDKVGLPGAVAHLYRPWLVSMLIAASGCERAKIKSGEPILDMRIASEAKSRDIPVTGLETIEEQLMAMASVPDDQQLAMLRANIAMHDRSNDMMETMVRLYLERRISAAWRLQLALAEKAGIPASAFAGFEQALIVGRNRKMRDRALPHLEKGSAFIAVGALHLPGTEGLVELIREKGYTVTAVE